MTDRIDPIDHEAQVAEAMLSRRRLLAASAGIGAAGLAAGVTGVVGAAPAGAENHSAPGPGPFGTGDLSTARVLGMGTNTVPIAQPGCTIRTVTAVTATASAVSSGASLVGVPGPPWGAYNSASQALFVALDIPSGSTLQQVDCYAQASGSTTDPFRAWWLFDFDNQAGSATVRTAVAPAGPGLTQQTWGKLNYLVGSDHELVVDLSVSSSSYYLVAVTYQYVPPAPGFYPITPTRVYDSRWSPAPAGLVTGVLTAPSSRVVKVSDGRSLTTGAITAPNVVPPAARAVTYNLTAAATSASGFLSITPGDATGFSASAINWSMPGAIANGGVVPVVDNAE